MQNPRSQRREGVVASRTHARAGATTTRSIQGCESCLQRRQSVRFRMDVPHMFYMRPAPLGESSGAVGKVRCRHVRAHDHIDI